MADKALVMGINQYRSVNHLRGCENDTNDVARLLIQTFHFPAENVKIQLNDDVTKSRVRPLMNWLFEDLSPGDRVALHFSGHGSYLPDADGDDADGVDELVCLADMDFNKSSSYFLDDELKRWTKKLPKGAFLTVFLDCCHSGTGTRLLIPPGKTKTSQHYPRIVESATAHRVAEAMASHKPGLEALSPTRALDLARAAIHPEDELQVVARFVEPPEQIEAQVQALKAKTTTRLGSMRELALSMNHVLVAACRSDQTAADAYISGDYHGAFSYYLCKTLSENGSSLDRSALIQRLQSTLATSHYNQVPQLDGPSLSGPLFSEGAPAPAPGKSDSGTPHHHFGTHSEPTEAPDSPAQARPSTTPVPSQSGTSAPSLSAPADATAVYLDLIAAYNRLLDLIQPGSSAAPLRAVSTTSPRLLCVHGIGVQQRGFSDAWWNALAPYAPSLKPGRLGSERVETYWSDLVNTIPTRALADQNSPHAEIARRLREQLLDRVEQQRLTTLAVRGVEPSSLADEPESRALVNLGLLDGLDDFVRYLAEPALRQQVLNRFFDAIIPLLRAGHPVDLIAHSWGTVISYEGLRLLDTDTSLPSGLVRNYFTLGAALSIPEIKHRLIPQVMNPDTESPDGKKPRLVSLWINLDAQGDPVGGPLQHRPYLVDAEYLNLAPVGCNPILGLLTDPVCAHSSYFNPHNTHVNRDILGHYLQRP